jgi:exonuclease VII large subunit
MSEPTKDEIADVYSSLMSTAHMCGAIYGTPTKTVTKVVRHWTQCSKELAAVRAELVTAIQQRDAIEESRVMTTNAYVKAAEQRDEARADAEKAKAEMVERYIASIQQEHDRWNAFREYAMDRQQFILVARYGDVCDALKMAMDQARKILLPNADGDGRSEPAPSRQ